MARQTHVSVDGVRLACQPGSSVLSLLTDAGGQGHLRSLCAGRGDCGLCHIRILEGEASPPIDQERRGLSREYLDQGFRLACQTRPLTDLRVSLERPAIGSSWHAISIIEQLDSPYSPYSRYSPSARAQRVAPDAGREGLGLAADVLQRAKAAIAAATGALLRVAGMKPGELTRVWSAEPSETISTSRPHRRQACCPTYRRKPCTSEPGR